MSDKVALVTAAGNGIGKACAMKLADDGYQLVLLSRSDNVKTVAKACGGDFVVGSLSDAEAIRALTTVAMEKHGRIDGVVFSSGNAAKGDVLRISDADWHAGLDLLLLSLVRLARSVTPIMQKQKSGAFVNISTLGAIEPDPAFPVSSVIRSSLGSFAKLYARRYAADGIRMNNLLPGFVENYPVSAERIAEIPTGRPARLTEIAGTVAFLLSPAAAYLNGLNVPIDGGQSRAV